MKSCRIHIMGASGTGVTTLGRALADAFAIPHHDTDDYFWQPTIPPYQIKRETAERRDREGRSLAKHQAWLATQPCPVLRLDGSRPLCELVAEVRGAIGG